MSNSNIENNDVNGAGTSCEGSSSGRCSLAQQQGPGRHHTTANGGRRRKWTQEMNRIVMECYFLSEPSVVGYRERMHESRKLKGMFEISEQRLMDQKRQIEKKRWLSDIELEEIRRKVVAPNATVVDDHDVLQEVDQVSENTGTGNDISNEINPGGNEPVRVLDLKEGATAERKIQY